MAIDLQLDFEVSVRGCGIHSTEWLDYVYVSETN